MGRQLFTNCHICGRAMGMGDRIRLLRQRESRPSRWTESGWALYICRDCADAVSDLLERLARRSDG